jgi:ribosomal protein S10
MKALIVEALEKEVNGDVPVPGKRLELPLIRMPGAKKLDLTGFDFDDLLA